MTAADVRETLRLDGVSTQVLFPDGSRASVEDYTFPAGALHVEYDGIANRASSVRVVLVRQPLRQTYDVVADLLRRLGEPSAGRDSLVQGLGAGPAVWLDAQCDTVLTYYRRSEGWWSDDVNTVLQVESLSRVRGAESPAKEIVAAILAAGPAAPRDAVEPGDDADNRTVVPEPDSPPRRTVYVAPVYPPAAKRLGVRGVVTLHLLVRADGKVWDATATEARPAGYGFESAALAAARRWRFVPASRAGLPVDGAIDVVVEFR